jgi:hypothetical protein
VNVHDAGQESEVKDLDPFLCSGHALNFDKLFQKVLLPSGGRTSKALATEPMVL